MKVLARAPDSAAIARWVPAAAGLAVLLPYLLTMNRTIGVVDSGELAACAYTLGIPHPTGYPTLMGLGYVVSHLLPLPPILSLNLLSAGLTAASVAFLALLYDRALATAFPRPSGPAEDAARTLCAGGAAVFTGLSGAWWGQAVGFEVYSLHALFVALVAWLFLRYVEEESASEWGARGGGPPRIRLTRRGGVFAFCLGLSFTNHLTTALLGPAFLLYYFLSLVRRPGTGPGRTRPGCWLRAVQRLLRLAPPFLLGLVPPYLCLMWRARALPRLDWGAPATLQRLLDHVTGREYRFIAGHFFDQVFAFQFHYATHWIPPAVGYLGLLAGGAGLYQLSRRSPRLAAWSGLMCLSGAVFACSYAANDTGNYLMLPVLSLGLWSAFALFGVWRRAGPRLATVAVLGLVAVTGACSWRDNDERTNTITRDFAYNMLSTLPGNAIVLTRQWDFWGAGSIYLQEIEGFRRDVVVVDYNLLHRDWYVDQLVRAHPEVMSRVRPEVARMKAAHAAIVPGRTPPGAEAAEHELAVEALANAIIDRSIAARPCFLTYDPFGPGIAPGYRWVPYHLAQQLVSQDTYLPATFPEYRFRMWRAHVAPQVVWTLKLYGEACLNRAVYERQYGHDDLALRYAGLVPAFDPRFEDREIPVQPSRMERQLVDVVARFRRAEAELAAGQIGPW